MFDMISDLFDRDGTRRQGRATGLRGLLQRVTGGNGRGDDRPVRDRYHSDDDDDHDRRYGAGRRRRRDDGDDDD